MSNATDKLREQLTARKTEVEADRQAYFEAAQARASELKRQLDEFNAGANAALAAKTAHITEIEGMLAALDALDKPPEPPQA